MENANSVSDDDEFESDLNHINNDKDQSGLFPNHFLLNGQINQPITKSTTENTTDIHTIKETQKSKPIQTISLDEHCKKWNENQMEYKREYYNQCINEFVEHHPNKPFKFYWNWFKSTGYYTESYFQKIITNIHKKQENNPTCK
eukprot:412716_1